jgi:hypothetical protein
MITVTLNSPDDWSFGISVHEGGDDLDDDLTEYKIIELGFLIFSIIIVYESKN